MQDETQSKVIRLADYLPDLSQPRRLTLHETLSELAMLLGGRVVTIDEDGNELDVEAVAAVLKKSMDDHRMRHPHRLAMQQLRETLYEEL